MRDAQARQQRCSSPALDEHTIAAAYSRIARDEERHAVLAFRFVGWAREREPSLASRVAAALVESRAVSPEVRDGVDSCLRGVLRADSNYLSASE
jgi:hypothetical protein